MSQRCVIIGASHAGVQLATNLRTAGWEGDITLIGDEPHLPYHRPPLSKELLRGDKELSGITLRPEKVFEKNRIQLMLGTSVESIQRDNKTLRLASGDELSYDKLALCTGARVKKIPFSGSDLNGIFYLRNAQDVEAIKQRVMKGKKAVIVGGGYIGLETAAVLRECEMDVSVVEMSERVLQRVTCEAVSEFYQNLHREKGVNIYCNEQVDAFTGESNVEKVTCKSGLTLDADLVVIGVGIEPNVELAEQAGLAIGDGIIVNEFALTNDPDIVAAGDCTYHPNALLGKSLRLECVQNANDQAKAAAATICDNPSAYAVHPWFWSDQYHIKLQIAGLSDGYDTVSIRGDKNGDDFSAWYFKAGQLIAADCVARPKDFMVAKQLLAKQVNVSPEQVSDESIELKSLLG